MKAYYFKHLLKFKIPGGTSRGVLNDKESWLYYNYKRRQLWGWRNVV